MKKVFCYLLVIYLVVALSISTYVCLDPFSMTYIVYIAVVVGVAVKGPWRRVMKFIQDKLGFTLHTYHPTREKQDEAAGKMGGLLAQAI